MSNLDPRIEEIRARYGLEKDDFWQIPQNRQWVCKHAALEIVATKANVIWSQPQIIQADTANGIAVLSVTGQMGERTEWATGEASPKNNKNSYPWAMAEKRAKDRVVLKLVGIHGLVYSEDEMPNGDKQEHPPRHQDKTDQGTSPKPYAAHQKRELDEIQKELLDCNSILAVDNCAKSWQFIAKRDGWSRDYIDAAAKLFAARREEIQKSEPGDAPDRAAIKNNAYAQAAMAG